MQKFNRRKASIFIGMFAVASLCLGTRSSASDSSVLLTGATITPDAAPGSVFQALTVDLPDYPGRAVDGAQTTSISPDGKTLLILTSGFNKLRDANGVVQAQDSSEYVFVYDISNPSTPAGLCSKTGIYPMKKISICWFSQPYFPPLCAPRLSSRLGLSVVPCVTTRERSCPAQTWLVAE